MLSWWSCIATSSFLSSFIFLGTLFLNICSYVHFSKRQNASFQYNELHFRFLGYQHFVQHDTQYTPVSECTLPDFLMLVVSNDCVGTCVSRLPTEQ
jgi:hypothetical protein